MEKLTPKQVKIEKSRAKSDTELIREGAELVFDKKSGKQVLQPSEKQIQEIHNDIDQKETHSILKKISEFKNSWYSRIFRVMNERAKGSSETMDNYETPEELISRQISYINKHSKPGEPVSDAMIQGLQKKIEGAAHFNVPYYRNILYLLKPFQELRSFLKEKNIDYAFLDEFIENIRPLNVKEITYDSFARVYGGSRYDVPKDTKKAMNYFSELNQHLGDILESKTIRKK